MAGATEQLPTRRTLNQSPRSNAICNNAAFWLLGLLNNSAYVIMIAGANEISSGSIGLVYLAAILPSLCLKFTCPYWFHKVRYELRIWLIAALMSAAYLTVALSTSRSMQLLGVAFGSAQAGLGESSCLALCALYEARRSLTCWSSGTGFAGVFGYAWVTVLHLWGGMSFDHVLLAANASAIAWLWVFHGLLERPQLDGSGGPAYRRLSDSDRTLVANSSHPVATGGPADPESVQLLVDGPATSDGGGDYSVGVASGAAVHDRRPVGGGGGSGVATGLGRPNGQHAALVAVAAASGSESDGSEGDKSSRPHAMSWRRRLAVTASLWPYMVPLATVYAAEYAMQAGTWTAIGFPVTDAASRHRFYEYANWMYQAGVFVSRSSGLLFQADRRTLWAMPALQTGLLAFFSVVAATHWPIYDMSLLLPAFIVGLLGGAVYVNAFTLITREMEPALQEFALAAASLGDSAGTAVADVAGILIQGCMFRLNGLGGADYRCGAAWKGLF